MCICNVAIIKGCYLVYKAPVFTIQLLIRNYTLYCSVTPTSIGMDLSLVKGMLECGNLQQLLENAKAKAKKILVLVHHDGEVMKQVMEQIKRAGEHHWWAVFWLVPHSQWHFQHVAAPHCSCAASADLCVLCYGSHLSDGAGETELWWPGEGSGAGQDPHQLVKGRTGLASVFATKIFWLRCWLPPSRR